MTSRATLIGDIVGSREAGDRAALHHRLGEALALANARLSGGEPLHITVGDEFQGWYENLGEAIAASLLVRLHLLPEADVRHGIGWGPVAYLDQSAGVEDGPGWWSAREAIDAVKRQASRAATRPLRTAFAVAAGVEGPAPAAVNAALMCRDLVVGSLPGRSVRILEGLLAGRSQGELADELGISSSAVSQRVRNDGLGVIVAAHEQLTEVR